MKTFEVTLTLTVDPDADFFDCTGFSSLGLKEHLEALLYDDSDILEIEIEVKEV